MGCCKGVIQRGTTPRVRIPVDFDLSSMDEVEVAFSSCGRGFSKSMSAGQVEVEPDEGGCVVSALLGKDDTLMLASFAPAVAQVRFSRGDARGALRPVIYRVEP